MFQEPFRSVSPPTASNLVPVDALAKVKARSKELSEKLSKLSTRSVNKRLKRQEAKLAESRELVNEMNKEIQDQDRTINKLEEPLHTAHTSSNCLRQKLHRSNSKIEANNVENSELAAQMETMECEFTEKIIQLEKRLEVLITEVELARHKRDVLSEHLDEIQSSTVQTKHGQKFIDGVRQCCMDLLSMNVGTCQVEPVIRSVLRNIASLESSALPKPSTLSGTLAEMKCSAYQQMSDEPNDTASSATVVPFVASQESLTEKRICHKWMDLWILSLVRGTTDWFNVSYDGRDNTVSKPFY